MNTVRLYQKNVYLKEFNAKITSLSREDKDIIVTLDQTAFFPTGGGQSCDTGILAGFEVTDVYEADGQIFHRLSCEATADNIREGAAVSGHINWERRFDNMQRHCGEHILSGMFFREYGGVNRGFHDNPCGGRTACRVYQRDRRQYARSSFGNQIGTRGMQAEA